MRTCITIAVVSVSLLAGSLRAEEHPDMIAAQHDLESAKSHLQAAAHDYGGRRKQAIADIDHALAQIKQGLAVVGKEEQKVGKKEQKLEHKDSRTERKLENLKTKEQEMEQR
jgi:septation ring formation regulator EzrA